jgi:hypothetical protein
MGFDEAFDIESRVHYIFWRSYAREALFVLALLWVVAVVLAIFAGVLPFAGVLGSFVFGLELGLGF